MENNAVGKAAFLPWEISCPCSESRVRAAPQRQAYVTQGVVGYSAVIVKEKKNEENFLKKGLLDFHFYL